MPEFVAGNHCIHCFNPGKPFSNQPTPEFISVQLFDLEEGLFWQEGLRAELEMKTYLQQGVLPCQWTLLGANFDWVMRYDAATPFIQIQRIPQFHRAFFQSTGPSCLLEYPNALVIPGGNFAFNGTVEIDWIGKADE